eukprot:jgi/Bigna1/80406/fgenesh1_pg.70_\
MESSSAREQVTAKAAEVVDRLFGEIKGRGRLEVIKSIIETHLEEYRISAASVAKRLEEAAETLKQIGEKKSVRGSQESSTIAKGHIYNVVYGCYFSVVEANLFLMTDNSMRTPLSYAAERGNLALCRYIVEDCGTDVSRPVSIANWRTQSPLFLAMKGEHHAVLAYLIEKKARMCSLGNGDEGQGTILFEAMRLESAHVTVKLLLERGAVVPEEVGYTRAPWDSTTILDIACNMSDEDFVSYLVTKADDKTIKRAFRAAARGGSTLEIMQLFLKLPCITQVEILQCWRDTPPFRHKVLLLLLRTGCIHEKAKILKIVQIARAGVYARQQLTDESRRVAVLLRDAQWCEDEADTAETSKGQWRMEEDLERNRTWVKSVESDAWDHAVRTSRRTESNPCHALRFMEIFQSRSRLGERRLLWAAARNLNIALLQTLLSSFKRDVSKTCMPRRGDETAQEGIVDKEEVKKGVNKHEEEGKQWVSTMRCGEFPLLSAVLLPGRYQEEADLNYQFLQTPQSSNVFRAVRLLIEHRADVNSRREGGLGESPLHTAILSAGDYYQSKEGFARGVPFVHRRNISVQGILSLCLFRADVTLTDNLGRTPSELLMREIAESGSEKKLPSNDNDLTLSWSIIRAVEKQFLTLPSGILCRFVQFIMERAVARDIDSLHMLHTDIWKALGHSLIDPLGKSSHRSLKLCTATLAVEPG